METIEKLLDDYRRADEEERIYLFLSHPQLRIRFTAISLAAEKQRVAQPARARKELKERGRWVLGRLGRCLGWDAKS